MRSSTINHLICMKIINNLHQSCLHLKIIFSWDIIHQILKSPTFSPQFYLSTFDWLIIRLYDLFYLFSMSYPSRGFNKLTQVIFLYLIDFFYFNYINKKLKEKGGFTSPSHKKLFNKIVFFFNLSFFMFFYGYFSFMTQTTSLTG